MIMDYKK